MCPSGARRTCRLRQSRPPLASPSRVRVRPPANPRRPLGTRPRARRTCAPQAVLRCSWPAAPREPLAGPTQATRRLEGAPLRRETGETHPVAWSPPTQPWARLAPQDRSPRAAWPSAPSRQGLRHPPLPPPGAQAPGPRGAPSGRCPPDARGGSPVTPVSLSTPSPLKCHPKRTFVQGYARSCTKSDTLNACFIHPSCPAGGDPPSITPLGGRARKCLWHKHLQGFPQGSLPLPPPPPLFVGETKDKYIWFVLLYKKERISRREYQKSDFLTRGGREGEGSSKNRRNSFPHNPLHALPPGGREKG